MAICATAYKCEAYQNRLSYGVPKHSGMCATPHMAKAECPRYESGLGVKLREIYNLMIGNDRLVYQSGKRKAPAVSRA